MPEGNNEGRTEKEGKRIKEREENEGGGWKKKQKKWDEVNGVKNPRTTRVSCQWPCLQTTFVDFFLGSSQLSWGMIESTSTLQLAGCEIRFSSQEIVH